MLLRRLQPYLLTLALVLLVVPLQVNAQGIDILGDIGRSFVSALQNVAYLIVINAFGLLVWFAANLLNFAVNAFVIGFGNTFTTTGIGVAVDQTWVIIRDFVNMFFIFGFVYIGFKMILNSSDSNTRRWLVNILLAALLVNFSLFITKFTIDITNQLAAQIAVNGLTDGTEIYRTYSDGTRIQQVDLGASFMARMGIANVMGLNFATVEGAGWGYILGVAILFLTAAFVFAAGGMLLIIRFAMLNIFMILSPAMFMSWILPSLKDTMQRFWSQFIGKALFAPIYLLFIYFSLQVISGLQTSIGKGDSFTKPDWAGTFNAIKSDGSTGSANSGELGTLPFFFLICTFLALSLIVADKLGMEGGAKAVSLGRSAINRVRREAVKQTGGRIVRASGAVASSAENHLNRRLGTMAQGGGASRAAARFLDRTAGAGLRGAQSASMGGGESYNARNKRVGEQNVRLNQLNQQSTRASTTNAQRSAYDTAVENGDVAARRDANNAMGGQVRRMSNDEMLAMVSANSALLRQAGFVQHLTDGHMTAIRDSGMMTNAEHTTLGNLRNASTINETAVAFEDVNATADDLNTAFAELGQTIRNMSAERRAGLGIDQLTNDNVAVHLSDNDLEGIEQSGRYTAAQMQQIRDAQGRGHAAIAGGTRQLATGNIAVARGFFGQQRREMMSNAQKAGHMPVSVFTDPNMQEYLTPDAVAQRLRNGVDLNDRNAIRANIDNFITSAPDANERQRRTNIWSTAARGGANASFISSLGLQNINTNQSNNQANQGSNSSLILPGSPGWNGGNVGPRPGPQP